MWLAWIVTAHAAPLTFAAADGQLGFHAVASLHEFDGRAKDFTATFDPETRKGEVRLVGKSLTTGIGARDSRMLYTSLLVQDHPEIRLVIDDLEGVETLLAEGKGAGAALVVGRMTIRGVEVALRVPAELAWEGDALRVRGSFPLLLAAFGIPDPSILTSTLRPEITVRFDLLGRPS